MQQVEITSWRNGLLRELLLNVPSEDTWDEILTRVDARLAEAPNKASWRGAQLTIEFGPRSVPVEELEALARRLQKSFETLVVAVVSSDMGTQEAAKRLGLNAYSMLPGSSLEADTSAMDAGSNALYVGNTVRSGQRIVHNGHVIVGGDVNAGAEVVAEGDILIFGTLRGLAHAGSQGDESARIVAGNMRPQQIRIAGKIARSPEDSGPVASGTRYPEVARIEGGEIQVTLV